MSAAMVPAPPSSPAPFSPSTAPPSPHTRRLSAPHRRAERWHGVCSITQVRHQRALRSMNVNGSNSASRHLHLALLSRGAPPATNPPSRRIRARWRAAERGRGVSLCADFTPDDYEALLALDEDVPVPCAPRPAPPRAPRAARNRTPRFRHKL